MRHFAALLLFAFVAQSFASQDLDEYLMEDDDGDRHPYVQCKIDFYDCMKKGQLNTAQCTKAYINCMKQLVPTIPPFVIQCKDQLKSCLGSASGFKERGKCFLNFAKCLKNGGPVSPSAVYMMDGSGGGVDPTRHPYLQCKIDMYKCMKETNKGKLECLKEYKKCMAVLIPTIPPFVIACKDQLKTCLPGASGIVAKAKCFKEFGKCLINKGPSASVFDAGEDILNAIEDAPAPSQHPIIQCKVDFYKCIKEGKPKVECAKALKSCMRPLFPSLPPYVEQCRVEYKKCAGGSKKWQIRFRCGLGFLKCLKNKGSS